jgi:hypothetical protein
MRPYLWGSLVALAAFAGAAVAVSEETKSSCSFICGWQVVLGGVALAAMLTLVAVAVVTVGYEIRRGRRTESDGV